MKKKSLVLFVVVFMIILISALLLTLDNEEERQGIVSLAFDDGYLTQYKIAYPEMEKYGYKGTLYILANSSGLFRGKELMTFDQAKEMQDLGWEIGSHSLNHQVLTRLSHQELERQLTLSKEILEKEGFDIKTLAFPEGYFNEEVIDETKKSYLASRALTEGYNDLNNLDPYNLKTKWLVIEKSPEEVCSWIEYSQNEGLWFILTFHSVELEPKNAFDTSIEDFREILDCINLSGIEVKTIKEVIEDEKRN